MNDSWQYYGVFLDENSRRNLIKFVMGYVDVPDDWKVYCDHMTIIYNDGSKNAYMWASALENKVGRSAMLDVYEIGVSDRCIAVKVSGYKSNNIISHVTVAVAPGAKPVESNKITNWKPVREGISILGKVGVVNKRH